MKWYRKDHYQIFQKQLGMDLKLKQSLEDYVLQYSKLAFKFVRKTGLEEQKIGTLNLQDITQAAFAGLCEGWNNIDWDRVKDKPNGIKSTVNYLSSYIDRQIKREVYRDATGVAIPEYVIALTKKEMLNDRLYGNWLYLFKTDDFFPGTYLRYCDIIGDEGLDSYAAEEANDRLTDMMLKYLKPLERDLVRCYFGLDQDKVSYVKMQEEFGMNQDAIRMRVNRAIKKLDNDECYNLLKDFL